jgi:threonine synthase
MKYISTRGQSPALSFSEILLGGLAPDGGLYLPEAYPQFSDADLNAMRGMNYRDLAFAVLSRLVDDIPAADLKAIIDKTYTAEVYGFTRAGQNAGDITPTLKLEDNLYLLSLSNGPTLAFKDMAMQLLGNLFEYVLAKTGRETNILGATSGDTGSAAEYAMRGKKGVRVFMLSPHQKMSRFQTSTLQSRACLMMRKTWSKPCLTMPLLKPNIKSAQSTALTGDASLHKWCITLKAILLLPNKTTKKLVLPCPVAILATSAQAISPA